jgi:hypothetical protein
MAIDNGNEGTSTLRGSFTYEGKSSFASGAIRLLVALKVSGVKLTELNGFGGRGVFVERSTATFKVQGTGSAIEAFSREYND